MKGGIGGHVLMFWLKILLFKGRPASIYLLESLNNTHEMKYADAISEQHLSFHMVLSLLKAIVSKAL